MSLLKRLSRSLFRLARHDQDLDDELRFHLAEEARRREARGDTRADAERGARRLRTE
jgi:hypothetical protein